jgi:hypothetical protein
VCVVFGIYDEIVNNFIFLLDKANEDVVGLSYELVDTFQHVFTCISATSEKPKIVFTPLVSDEPAELFFEKGSNNETVKCTHIL